MYLKIFRVPFSRHLHSKPRVGVNDISDSEIDNILRHSSWSIKSLLPKDHEEASTKVHPHLLKKILHLSGFKAELNEEQEARLVGTLQAQVFFINNLYQHEKEVQNRGKNNDYLFRLIASDHKPSKGLTMEQLSQKISNIQHDVNDEKGELDSSICTSQMNANKEGLFFIKHKGE